MDADIRQRYSRQIAMDEIGEEGQCRMLRSKVVIVGCGALGSMVAMQLAGAGIGRLMIADFDTVDISNLQRQFFFTTAQAGEGKGRLLKKRMEELNPDVRVELAELLVNRTVAMRLFADADFVVDATDNPSSKQMVEDVCKLLGKPCCIGGVDGFRGQVLTIASGSSGFSELFPDSDDGGVLPCSLGGVAGPAAALCASLQASEVIKWIVGTGTPLKGRMLTFDLLDNHFATYLV